MSALRGQLASELARFDDEAFAALANRGLLRRARKDLEKQPARVVEDSDDAIVLQVGEQRVRMNASGFAHATCTCRSAGVCQHILAAAISLQGQRGESAEEASPGTAEDPLVELRAALLRIPTEAMVLHAGRAGYRWAWEFVQDLDPAGGLSIGGDRNLVLRFVHPRLGFRYVGGGLENLIADARVPHVERYRVAAVLAYQRAHGLVLTAPKVEARARTGTLQLGKDYTDATPTGEALIQSRMRLRESASQLLVETVELGLAHLSAGIHERYATLAVWAQGAGYYRLALLLRRVTDHVELLLDRAGGADEHRLLDELSVACALVSALGRAAAQGSEPSYLLGRARTEYDQTKRLELLGLGASPWRSQSGYSGLTMILWSPADQEFFSCTDARPEKLSGFNPISRYRAAGPWAGLGSPLQATGRRVVLTGAQVNAGGRLSSSDTTSAVVQPMDPALFAGHLPASDSWAALARQRTAMRRSLLSELQPMKDWAVLKPRRFGKATFSSVTQSLVWPLIDGEDSRLDVVLPYGEYSKHAIARIEQLREDGLREGTMVVARLRSGAAGLVAEPLSLVRATPAADANPIDCLHFDDAPKPSFVSKWLDRVQHKVGSGEPSPESTPAAARVDSIPGGLREFRAWLQCQAERGVARDQDDRVRVEAAAWSERASADGFTAFRRLRQPAQGGAALLLRAHYLCMQYERLLVGIVDEETAG